MAFDTFLETDLFRNLSEEERLKVDRFTSRSSTDVPKFFNAGTQAIGEEPNAPISKEFEAFLILQALKSPGKISNALKWFTEAADLQLKRDDRDELLKDAFEKERTDALKLLQEVQARTQRFSSFRDEFETVEIEKESASSDFPTARFTNVPEISLIMRDSQAAMGEISSKRSRAEHLVVEDAVLDVERQTRERLQESVGDIADAKIAQELLSWRDVFTLIQSRVSGRLVSQMQSKVSGGMPGFTPVDLGAPKTSTGAATR